LLGRFIERGQRLPLPEEIIVFTSLAVDKRRRIFKLLEQKGAVVECSPLKGEALRRWINERVDLAGKKIDPQALELLMLSGESNLWRLQHEVEKFATYLEDDQEMITAPVVELLLSGERHGSVFNLVDALGEGDRGAAFERLQQLLRRREPPLKIFFMIARHFRLLLETRLLQEEQGGRPDYAAELKLPPFVAQKLRQQARSYSPGLLQEVIILLQQEDHKIKTGRADPELALETVVAGIGRLAAGRGSAT
jgi:DNA polymerase-3 subunit delta